MTRSLLLILLLGGAFAPARADQFLLADGGQLDGELANPEQSPRTEYVIQLASGRLTLSRDQVLKVVRVSPARAEYERLRHDVADTPEGHWQMAEWCREHKLAGERRAHLERVIELDPNQAGARRALGYSQFGGQWKTTAEVMTQRGYVLHRGKWRLPQEIEIEDMRRKNELAEKEWIRQLAHIQEDLHRPDRAEAAAARLAAIDDPYALAALDRFLQSEGSTQYRAMALASVARIDDPSAVHILVGLTLSDPEQEIRRDALEQIARTNPAPAVISYIKQLKSKNNDVVNLAASALGYLQDKKAIPALIDALVTKHKFTVQQGDPNATSATFVNPNSTGGVTNPTNAGVYGGNPGGLTMGGGPKVVVQSIRNRDVLDALVLLTRQNFEYDGRAWRVWYASQKTSESLDARRDE